MNLPKIAVQTYSVLESCGTQTDYAESLKKIGMIGYTDVQMCDCISWDPYWLRETLDEAGLVGIASHESMESLDANRHETAKKLCIIGCQFVGIGGANITSLAETKAFANHYNTLVPFWKEQGITLTYHNHSFEFLKENGRTLMDELITLLSSDIAIVADVCWIQLAGLTPANFLHKIKDRLQLVHYKDWEIIEGQRGDTAAIGEGNIDFQAITDVCKEAGTEYYIVEQDNHRRDAFTNLTISYKAMKELLMNKK